MAALAPKGQYVVIDTANNRVYLRDGERILREMVASCGSGNVLVDPVGGRTWTFDTPRGQFQVRSKVNNPIWIKPDWAFIEEGEPIPSKGADRAERNMMGDYALGIGNGYFIHGTLYKRLLGRNVSHGCVRLGDEDLEFLFKTATLGTKVIIF
jgi:L,D-transpeptidase YbiS